MLRYGEKDVDSGKFPATGKPSMSCPCSLKYLQSSSSCCCHTLVLTSLSWDSVCKSGHSGNTRAQKQQLTVTQTKPIETEDKEHEGIFINGLFKGGILKGSL